MSEINHQDELQTTTHLSEVAREVAYLLISERDMEITPEIRDKISNLHVFSSLKNLFSFAEKNGFPYSKKEKIKVGIGVIMMGSFTERLGNSQVMFIHPLSKYMVLRNNKKILLHELSHFADKLSSSLQQSESNDDAAWKSFASPLLAILIATANIARQSQDISLPSSLETTIMVVPIILVIAGLYNLRKATNSESEKKAYETERLHKSDDFATALKKL